MTASWVHKRDGRLVPFDADKISRSLFAATEALGRPDAFLARELADGAAHFLAADADGDVPTTSQIAELVTKVVRELGHPALARAYAENVRRPAGARRQAVPRGGEVVVRAPADAAPSDFLKSCLRQYALQAVFARDLAAAHADGLLTITGLEAPAELAGCVLGPAAPEGGLPVARQSVGAFVAFDGVEHAPESADAGGWVRALTTGLSATGLRAVVNLNVASPPPWADGPADGPLFVGGPAPPRRDRLAERAEALRDALLAERAGRERLRIDWHLGEGDMTPAGSERLLRAARHAWGSTALAFVFDRPRRPVALAEGIDRRHPAALLTVGLNLPRLVSLAGTAAEPFLQKLGSLARLALSAAVQKREALRRYGAGRPALAGGFLPERARLVVAPLGLYDALRGHGPDLTRRAVQRLRDVLRQDGGQCLVETCVDGPADFGLDGAPPDSGPAGLTAWDVSLSPQAQLKAAGAWHAVAEGGTAAVLLPDGAAPDAEQVADLLRWAWRHTDVVRLRFVRAVSSPRQLPLPAA